MTLTKRCVVFDVPDNSRMCRQLLLVLFILFDVRNTKSQEAVHYLQNAMWDLENRLNTVHSKRRIDSFRFKPVETAMVKGGDNENVPMLSLTKSELAALYEAAIKNEQNAAASSNAVEQQTPYVQAILEDTKDDKQPETEQLDQNSGEDGYYYYYYPVNSFMDGISSANNEVSSILRFRNFKLVNLNKNYLRFNYKICMKY